MHRVKNIGSISVINIWSGLLLYTANCSKAGSMSSKCSVSHQNGVGFPILANAQHAETGFKKTLERLELGSEPNTMKFNRDEGPSLL